MFKYILLNGVLAVSPIETYESPLDTSTICALSQSERDRLFRECEWATYRSIACLEECQEEIARLTDFNGRGACKAAVQAAVCALAGATCKERVVISLISVLARYLEEASGTLYDAYFLALDARAYALKADHSQERLWLDE